MAGGPYPAAGGHVFTWKWGSRLVGTKKSHRAAHAALDSMRIDYTSALGTRACGSELPAIIARAYGVDVDSSRVVVTTGSSAAFILAFMAMFEPGDPVAVTVPGYPPPAYSHRARLRAGTDRDLERDRSVDRRSLARRAPQDAAQGRAGCKPGHPTAG